MQRPNVRWAIWSHVYEFRFHKSPKWLHSKIQYEFSNKGGCTQILDYSHIITGKSHVRRPRFSFVLWRIPLACSLDLMRQVHSHNGNKWPALGTEWRGPWTKRTPKLPIFWTNQHGYAGNYSAFIKPETVSPYRLTPLPTDVKYLWQESMKRWWAGFLPAHQIGTSFAVHSLFTCIQYVHTASLCSISS